MSEPKNHHYLPIFYLRRWISDEDRRLVCFAWKHGRLISDRLAPKGTGREPFLYSLRGVRPEERQSLEKGFFGGIDDKAASVMDRLLADDLTTLTPAERRDWARFLTSLQQRHPTWIEKLRSEYREGFEEDLDRLERYSALHSEPDNNAISLRQFIETHSPHMLDDDPLMLLTRFIGHADDVAAITEMRWWRFNLQGGRGKLLTCDSPLVIKCAGYNDPRCLIYLPLSPSSAFLAAHDAGHLDAIKAFPPGLIRLWLNEHIVREAHTYIYGADSTEKRFIAEHRIQPSR